MWPFTSWSEQHHVENAISKKRIARDAALQDGIRLANNASESDDAQFLLANADQIVNKTQSRGWRCTRVLEAYIRSAGRAQARTNCLTEILFVQALEEAKRLDKWISSATESEIKAKLLLGVPVSIKDMFDVKGVDTTSGFARYCDDPAAKDSSLAKILRENGAIIFCKTNIPQTLLAFECSNPLFGRTLNPYSPNHTSGGSSGGEAALLAQDGSAMGIGSDIGGSLRIPAGYSGCYALKTVSGRFSRKGIRALIPGYEAIQTAVGPMGRSVADLELCTRVIIGSTIHSRLHDIEESLLPLPYREVKLPSRLRFGYYFEDGFIPTSPACTRAVSLTLEAVKQAGHECIPLTIPAPVEALGIFQALASSDGYRTLLSHLCTGEPREPFLFLPTLGPRIPSLLRNIACWLLRTFAGETDMADLVGLSREKGTSEVWKWQHRRKVYAQTIREYAWEEHKLDAIICPVQASPAVTHGATKRLSPLALQTILWNVVDSTVGVLPVTRVDPTADVLPFNFGEKIKAAGSPLLSQELYRKVYNPKEMEGLPLGIQLVAPAWEEERMLEIMKVVDAALETNRGGPFRPNLFQSERKIY